MFGGGGEMQSGYVNLKDTLKGGPSAPSNAESFGLFAPNSWMDSPFVVGGGSATSAAQTSTGGTGGIPGTSPVGGGYAPSLDAAGSVLSQVDITKVALILMAGVVAVKVLK